MSEQRDVKMWIEQGIFYGVYAEGVEIDLDAAKRLVSERVQMMGDKSYPCLVDIRGLKSMTKEARIYMADEGAGQMIAAAMITGNPFTRTFAHLFLTLNKPKVPIRLFGSMEDGRDWLRPFVR
jgi:hypothetical protein